MIVLIIFAVVLVGLYIYNIRTFNYWAKKGVKHDKPVIFFGNYAKNFLMKQHRTQTLEEMYLKYPKEKVVGFYRSTTPELVLRDPEIIKKVLKTDFAYFYARGFHPYPKLVEPIMHNLFTIEGDEWKMLRQKLTPAFSIGKMKAMFPMIIDKTEKLTASAINATKSGAAVDARDLMARYTIDVIVSYGFGIDSDSQKKQDSEIRKFLEDIFESRILDFAVAVLKEVFPALAQNLKFFGRIEKRLFSIVEQILKLKGFKPTGSGDLFDLLLECKQNGPIEIDSLEKLLPDGTPEKVMLEINDFHIAAQTFMFLLAGFETSSSSSSYVLHQLAYNPEIQKKVHKEIDEVMAKYHNKLSYDSIKEMKYLEWVLKEALRIFPVVGYLMRVCCRKYTFQDIGLTIDPGVKATVPVQALHMDPEYWDNPEEFRPERFHPAEFTAKQKAVYLPFGEGPRNCIGVQLGMLQALAGLADVLSIFTVEPAPESVRIVEVNPAIEVVQTPKSGKLPLIFRKRN